MDGVDVAAGWQMRFRPVFPVERPAELIPVWNLVGHYLPETAGGTCLRGRPADRMSGRAWLSSRWSSATSSERRCIRRRRFR